MRKKTFVLLGNGFVLQRVFSSFLIDFSGDMHYLWIR